MNSLSISAHIHVQSGPKTGPIFKKSIPRDQIEIRTYNTNRLKFHFVLFPVMYGFISMASIVPP